MTRETRVDHSQYVQPLATASADVAPMPASLSERLQGHAYALSHLLLSRKRMTSITVPVRLAGEVMRDIDEAASSLRASGWRSIDSAPKDGTWILFYVHRYAVPTVGKWYERGRYESGFWMSSAMQISPTHWMPLPTPPVAKDREAQVDAAVPTVNDGEIQK